METKLEVAQDTLNRLYNEHVTVSVQASRMRSILQGLVGHYTTTLEVAQVQYCRACERLVDDCAESIVKDPPTSCIFGPARRLLRELS